MDANVGRRTIVETKLADTEREIEALRSQRSEIDHHLSKLEMQAQHYRIFLEVEDSLIPLLPLAAPQMPPPPLATAAPVSTTTPPTKFGTLAFAGKGLPEACVMVLLDTARPMGNVELSKTLLREGFPIIQKDPAQAVETAMRRRAKTNGDVVRVDAGTWGMMAWFTPEDILKFVASVGGMPGRDMRDHGDKTRNGVQSALERGVKFGRKPKLSEDQMTEMFAMVDAGEAIVEVARAYEVTPTAVHRWIRTRRGVVRGDGAQLGSDESANNK